MNIGDFDFYIIFDLFVHLLIGMGLKIALMPFLDLTADMEVDGLAEPGIIDMLAH